MHTIIVPLQLKAARNVLNLGVRDIAKVLKVSKATINKAELGNTRDFFHKYGAALTNFFSLNNIIFPNTFSITYDNSKREIENSKLNNSITRFQFKAARHILSLTQQDLAAIIKVNRSIISKAEQVANTEYIKLYDQKILDCIKEYYCNQNIEFPNQMSIFFKKIVDN